MGKQSQYQTGRENHCDTFEKFPDRIAGIGLAKDAVPLIERTCLRVGNDAALVHPGLLASGHHAGDALLPEPRDGDLVGRA
jgi:hypothetical protein